MSVFYVWCVDADDSRNSRPLTPMSAQSGKLEPAFELNLDSRVDKNREPLLDEDPFAKVDGVKVIVADSGSVRSAAKGDRDKEKEGVKVEKKQEREGGKDKEKDKERKEKRKGKESQKSKSKECSKEGSKRKEKKGSASAQPARASNDEDPAAIAGGQEEDGANPSETLEDKENAQPQTMDIPPTPLSPERRKSRAPVPSQVMPPPPLIADMIARAAAREKHRVTKGGPFTLADFVSDPEYLKMLLEYLSFYDWCVLASVSRVIRIMMVQKKEVREEILERYLKTVGYERWRWEDAEPLSLSLQVGSQLVLRVGDGS